MKNLNAGGKALTLLGFAATGAGFIVNLLSDWIGGKQMEAQIAEKVAEEVAKQLKGVSK